MGNFENATKESLENYSLDNHNLANFKCFFFSSQCYTVCVFVLIRQNSTDFRFVC